MLGIGGIAAVVNVFEASKHVSDILQRLRHLGLDVINIISNGKINDEGTAKKSVRTHQFYSQTKLPCEGNDFRGFDFGELSGEMAIGSCSDIQEKSSSISVRFQHTAENIRLGPIAIAISGKIIADPSRSATDVFQNCCTFSQEAGLDKLMRMIINSKRASLLETLLDILPKFAGAYSLVIMTEEELFAVRGPRGIFPLFLSSLNGGILVSSEDVAFCQNNEIAPIREIAPGEIILIKRNVPGFLKWKFSELPESFCAMLCIHMSSPMTTLRGKYFEDFRQALGEQMGIEYRDQIRDSSSKIVPLIHSGKDQGTGVSRTTGVHYQEHIKLDVNRPLSRNRPLTRIDFKKALARSHQKSILRSDRLAGQRITVVEGIMITAMNMRVINYRLRRQSGVSSIATCITSPPVVNACPFGMEHSDKNMLLAANHSIEQISKHIESDALMFLPLEKLEKVLSQTFNTGFCTGCFGGKYPE